MTQATNTNSNSTTRNGVKVDLIGLSRYYKDVAALKSMNLSASPGELIVLLGPSGCGKTTAIRALAGLEVLDGGTVMIGSKDVTRLPASRRNIGMVFQSYSLFPNMTAKANVEFGLKVRKVSSSERSKRSAELLDLIGLSPQADRYPHQLSGGQQQRVALARALAIKPEVLLLDEPLSALDAKVRAQLRDEIRRIQLELGITTFFVTHDQEEALALADRIAVMRAGEIEQIDTPLSVYSQPTTEFVAEFVGKVNRLSGVIVSQDKVNVESIGAISYDSKNTPFQTGTNVQVLVRPEALGIMISDTGQWRLVSKSFLGASVKLNLTNPTGQKVIVELTTGEATLIEQDSQLSLFGKSDALLVQRA